MARQFPESGDLFEGRFRIREAVGSGGFARIFHAVQTDLNRDVALKVLEPQQLDDASAPPDQTTRKARNRVERFRREARNVSQLRDPHTITLFDYGQTDDDLLYMVFEYVDGEDLQDVSAEQAPIAADRVVDILEQVLASLQEAHKKGMLHRDIKPANLMIYDHVGRTDQVKVLDFGIAKAVLEHADKTVQDLTREGMMLGTPRYMAPEQLKGEDIGPPSDLYSLGLVAYELLAGRQAIEADSTMTIISRQVGPAPIILPFDADVPPNLRAVIHRMVAKDREERFQTTEQVMRALEAWDSDRRPDWAKQWVFSDQAATTEEQNPLANKQASVKTSPMRKPPEDHDDGASRQYRTDSPGDDSTTMTDVSKRSDHSPGANDPDQGQTQPEELPPTADNEPIPEDARTIPSMNLPDSLSHLREENESGNQPSEQPSSTSSREDNPHRQTARERPAERKSPRPATQKPPSTSETEARPNTSPQQHQQEAAHRAGSPPGLRESSTSGGDKGWLPLSLDDPDDRRAVYIMGIFAICALIVIAVGLLWLSGPTNADPTVVPQQSAEPDAAAGESP